MAVVAGTISAGQTEVRQPSRNAVTLVTGPPFSVIGATAINRETIRVFFSAEPRHSSRIAANDALNLSNWTVLLLTAGTGGDPVVLNVYGPRAAEPDEVDLATYPNAYSLDVFVDRRLESGQTYQVAVSGTVATQDLGGDLMAAVSVQQNLASFAGVFTAPVTLIASWCSRGINWLLAQFRGKPKIEALLCALLDQVQEIEQFFTEANELRALQTAEGQQLDDVGTALGFPRDPGLTDAEYRVTLEAVALARAADGRPNEMIGVLQTLLQGTTTFTMTEYPPASVRFEVADPLTYADGHRFARVLRLAKPACVDFALIYAPLGYPIITFDDDVIHPPVPFAEEGVAGSGGVFMEEDSGR